MSDETTTRTRAKRGTVQHGLRAMALLCIPVPKDDLRKALEIEEAFIAATNTGDMSKLLALPGLRIARTERRHTFGPLPKLGDTDGSDAGQDGQTDIEDAIGGGQGDGEGEADEGETGHEAPVSGGRRRRAA